MRSVTFESPWQDHVDAIDLGLQFSNGETKDVPDDKAEILLKHPQFREASAPARNPFAPSVSTDAPHESE
jgi:hypothetical protein